MWKADIASGSPRRLARWGIWVSLLLLPPRAFAAPSSSDVRTAAERWCAGTLARSWARPGVDAFAAGRIDSARGFWFAHVGQRWRGLAVEPVDVCVTLDADGRVRHTTGAFAPRPEPAGTWALGGREAEARGRRAANVRGTSLASPERVLALSGGTLRPAYRVRSAPTPGLEPNELVVDAERGDVLIARGGAWHAVGNVYPSDGRDTLAAVTLTGLDAGDSVLSGPLVRAEDGTSRLLVSATGDFRLTPSVPDTTQFDEVNVWWYVQQYLAWLGSRGYRGFVDTLHVRTHATIAPNVAYTSGNYVLLADSVTNFAHDAAKARDVVTHELQHFVSEGYGLVHGSSEGDALQEGLSDYMAAACTGDPRIGEWEYRLYPNGVTTVASDPAVFNYAHFGQVGWGGVEVGSTWANGMIFSGALWDLRTQLGATADSLVLEALSRIPASPTFADFAQGVLAADLELHTGADSSAIRIAMNGRGIRWYFVPTVVGPVSLLRNQPGTWHISVLSSVDSTDVRWSVRHLVDGVEVETPLAPDAQGRVTWADTAAFTLTVTPGASWGAFGGVATQAVGMGTFDFEILSSGAPYPAQTGHFWVTVDSSVVGSVPQYQVRRNCGAAGCTELGPAGNDWSFSYEDTLDFAVDFTLQSRWGEVRTKTLKVTLRQFLFKVTGPTTLQSKQSGHFALSIDYNALEVNGSYTLAISPYCGAAPCGPPILNYAFSASGNYADTLSFAVIASSISRYGARLRDSLFVKVTPTQFVILGPTALARGQSGSFSVQSNATLSMTPPRWAAMHYCGLTPCTIAGTSGIVSTFTWADTTDFAVVGQATNRWGAVGRETTFVSVSPPLAVVDGPRYSDGVHTGLFAARPDGVGPWAYRWQRYRWPRDGSAAALVGSDSTAVVVSPQSYDLQLTATDGHGRNVVADRIVRRITSAIAGPSQVRAGDVANFSAGIDSLFDDMSIAWHVRGSCHGAPCGDGWQPLGGAVTQPLDVDDDREVGFTLTGADGFVETTSTTVTIAPPVVHVAWDDSSVALSHYAFKASATGRGPFAFDWFRPGTDSSSRWQSLGRGERFVLHEPPPFEVIALATDANGRTGADTLRVEGDSLLVARHEAAIGLLGASVAGGSIALEAWAPAGGSAQLAVYDITGREVKRWFDGPWPGGTRVLTRSTSGLAPGTYFCRWRVGSARIVRRLAVVR